MAEKKRRKKKEREQNHIASPRWIANESKQTKIHWLLQEHHTTPSIKVAVEPPMVVEGCLTAIRPCSTLFIKGNPCLVLSVSRGVVFIFLSDPSGHFETPATIP